MSTDGLKQIQPISPIDVGAIHIHFNKCIHEISKHDIQWMSQTYTCPSKCFLALFQHYSSTCKYDYRLHVLYKH